VGELRIIKEPADQPLSEQMLDEHFVDLGFGEVGIEGGAAESDEFRKSRFELRSSLVRFVDVVVGRELGDQGPAALFGCFIEKMLEGPLRPSSWVTCWDLNAEGP
jgi:hypothetical protein